MAKQSSGFHIVHDSGLLPATLCSQLRLVALAMTVCVKSLLIREVIGQRAP